MGLKILNELWRSDDRTTGATRSVLIVLCVHAKDETRGDCWPSMSTIAREAGLNRITVFKALKMLEAGGQIEKTGRVPIRRCNGSPDMAPRQFVNEYRIGVFREHGWGVCRTHTP